MGVKVMIERLVRLAERLASVPLKNDVEFAMRLRNGLLVTRDRFRPGVPSTKRRITIFRPETMPSGIVESGVNAGRDKVSALGMSQVRTKTPQLTYTRTGKKENKVEAIWSPTTGKLSTGTERARSSVKISRAFLGHLDKRGIQSTTVASAFGGAAGGYGKRASGLETAKLVRGYKSMGYAVDNAKIDQHVAQFPTAFQRAIQRGQLMEDAVPMRRIPKAQK